MELRGTCYPCYNTVITNRGNFWYDDHFKSARQALNDLMVQMHQAKHQQILQPPNKVDYLMAELGAWQQSGQNLGAALKSCRHDDYFPTVFKFEPESMKMLIDVTGCQPHNLKLNVLENVVELTSKREEALSNNTSSQVGQNSIGYASRKIKISYTLPQKLVKECVQCSLSQDGILYISAPWLRC